MQTATEHCLADFRDLHAGATALVCGCGASLNALEGWLQERQPCVTIGVNDVGRLFHPDYLVVLNPRRQFTPERFRYVEASQARFLFTQLNPAVDLRLPVDFTPEIVRFRLGRSGGTDFSDPNVLHFTQNSPYVALCLAAHLGAAHIGLIGVDFTDHHFFAQTGAHALSGTFDRIDAEYRALADALARRGVEVVNLSRQSRLTAFPKVEPDDFLPPASQVHHAHRIAETNPVHSQPLGPAPETNRMKIAVERHSPGLVGDFLEALADTAARLGHTVTRAAYNARPAPADTLCIVWNGRNHRGNGPTLFCEHGWLPRWDYQISPKGINADSHLAPFLWDGKPLSDAGRDALQRHLETLRESGPADHAYMRTELEALSNLPEAFLLVPLQVEWDTNIRRHVPACFRGMQALIDYVAASNPPFPILYKQHPADARRTNQHLRLVTRRRQDVILPHNRGNIHQILKSGRCQGIVSLNSNVVHDGLLWGVPAAVLGRNIWPDAGPGPFLRALPANWAEWDACFARPEVRDCTEAYALYLIENQWSLHDARDPERVARLLDSAARGETRAAKPVATGVPAAPRPSRPPRSRPVVNVVAANRGWHFEDWKRAFAATRREDVEVVATENARRDADAWIFIRTREASATPDPTRTLVQIHDLYDDGLYRPGGGRHIVSRCAGVALTHPDQRAILEHGGINLRGKRVVDRPVGAFEAFTLRDTIPPRFTIGWAGRPTVHRGVELTRAQWFVDAVRTLDLPRDAFAVTLLGERLETFHEALTRAGISVCLLPRTPGAPAAWAETYRTLDCLVVTSASDPGPLSLFEALASGVPVVSTPVGWSPRLLRPGENGFLANGPAEITASLQRLYAEREDGFARRAAIRATGRGLTTEAWVKANLDAVLSLTHSVHV